MQSLSGAVDEHTAHGRHMQLQAIIQIREASMTMIWESISLLPSRDLACCC